MGVFTRPDSPVWWLWLETTKSKERTEIRIGETTAQRRDSKRIAEDRYHQRMNELAARLYRLPSSQPQIRFDKYAETYATDVIAHHKGERRERELLKNLTAFFGSDLLSAIDVDRVRAYQSERRDKAAAVTINREIDLLKSMLRDAVPKYIAESPLADMKRLPIVKPRRRLLSKAEEKELLALGDAQDRAILILGLDTLVRLGDLLDLQRSDRRGPWLFIRDPKSGEPYEVALSPRAERALDAIRHKEPHYFTKFRRATNPRDWTGSVRHRLERLCAAADPPIPYGLKNGVTFHWATRRTGATRMLVDRRVPLPIVQRQGNWKNPDVLLAIYAEAGKDDLLAAVGQKVGKRRRSA